MTCIATLFSYYHVQPSHLSDHACRFTQFVVATNYIESNREAKPKARAKPKGYYHQHDDAAQAVEVDRSLEGTLKRFSFTTVLNSLRLCLVVPHTFTHKTMPAEMNVAGLT
jgi:hypothetical protein